MTSGEIVLLAEVGESGGTSTYARQVVNTLSRAGFDLEVHYVSVGVGVQNSAPRGRRVSISWHSLSSWKPRYFIQAMFLLRAALRGQNPDQLLVVSVGTPGLFLSPLLRRGRVLYILHTYPHGLSSRIAGRFFGSWLPQGSTVMTVSRFAAAQLNSSWVLSSRGITPKVLLTGVPENLDIERLPSKIGQIRAVINVLCVASCEDHKNPQLWLEVARVSIARNPGLFQFTWLGGGSMLEKMKATVKEHDLENQVLFLGWVADPDPAYLEADIYLQVSRVESLGISVIDAARHSLPSVVTNVGGLPEVVIDNHTGFVREESASSIADALERLALDPRLRLSMGRRARNLYLNRFSYPRWEQGFLSIVSTAVSDADSSRRSGREGGREH